MLRELHEGLLSTIITSGEKPAVLGIRSGHYVAFVPADYHHHRSARRGAFGIPNPSPNLKVGARITAEQSARLFGPSLANSLPNFARDVIRKCSGAPSRHGRRRRTALAQKDAATVILEVYAKSGNVVDVELYLERIRIDPRAASGIHHPSQQCSSFVVACRSRAATGKDVADRAYRA
jgi:hypothetical protein